MTRRTEVLLRRSMDLLSFMLVLCGLGLSAWVFIRPETAHDTELSLPQNSTSDASVEIDPKVKQLGSTKMSKTVVPQADVVVKPPAPELSTLIRVKGIMAYGDPKDNEAIIEVFRTSQTKTYRIGETVQEINATITAIDKAVTFSYDGKTTRLEMKANDRADFRPVATPGDKPDTFAAGQTE